jgi:hypothetical protein
MSLGFALEKKRRLQGITRRKEKRQALAIKIRITKNEKEVL